MWNNVSNFENIPAADLQAAAYVKKKYNFLEEKKTAPATTNN